MPVNVSATVKSDMFMGLKFVNRELCPKYMAPINKLFQSMIIKNEFVYLIFYSKPFRYMFMGLSIAG